MKLFGLSGYAGSGKDTVAGFLLRRYSGYRKGFADPLREAAQAVFGLTPQQMADRALKEQVVPYWGLSPRQLLQRLGTEGLREVFGGDVWVKSAALRLETLQALDAQESVGSDLVVFTDVRFAEEAAFIRERGGVVVDVRRPGVGPVNDHVSDQGLPDECVDFVLHNAGDLADLQAAVNAQCDGWFMSAAHLCDLGRAA